MSLCGIIHELGNVVNIVVELNSFHPFMPFSPTTNGGPTCLSASCCWSPLLGCLGWSMWLQFQKRKVGGPGCAGESCWVPKPQRVPWMSHEALAHRGS